MKPFKLPWKTILFVTGIVAICMVGVYYIMPGFFRVQEVKRKESDLRHRLREREDKKVSLERYLHRLETEPIMAEKVARDEMGMSKDNEIIYKFDKQR